MLRWTGAAFVLRDLGSTNGTWVNQKRLAQGQGRPLQVGDSLMFGNLEECWTCVDVSPPPGAAVLVTDRLRWPLSDASLHVGPPNVIVLEVGEQPYPMELSPGEYDVLSALAAQRLRDRALGVQREGWVLRKDFGEETCKNVMTLNQHIKRFRDKVRELDVLAEDASQIIEQTVGEIRIGVSRIRID